MKLAQTLIDAWYSDDFDYTSYDDNYRERLQRLIEMKKRGQEVAPPEEEEESEVINLMEALKQSVTDARKKQSRSRKRRRSA